jgi:hypothetical protein
MRVHRSSQRAVAAHAGKDQRRTPVGLIWPA